jgi:hypothetical protein
LQVPTHLIAVKARAAPVEVISARGIAAAVAHGSR